MSTVTGEQKEMNVEMRYAQDTVNSIKVDIDNIVECTISATKIDANDQSFTYFYMEM